MKQRNLDKYEAEKELRKHKFFFSYLNPVSSRFKLELWKKAKTYNSFTLYTKIVNNHLMRRVIKTINGDYFYLTN